MHGRPRGSTEALHTEHLWLASCITSTPVTSIDTEWAAADRTLAACELLSCAPSPLGAPRTIVCFVSYARLPAAQPEHRAPTTPDARARGAAGASER